tara:strand:+ start:159 stop:818 length:660 start_codon:yes stop_codon:yes gene_type:complete
MAIQITNDPINQFLDNLPRYALELKRQDAQAAQFDRQMDLREQAAENQQTLFDLTRNKQKFQSDIIKEQIGYHQDFRNAKNKWSDYRKDYEPEYESYKQAAKAEGKFLGFGSLIAPKDYEHHLSRLIKMSSGGQKVELEKAMKEYKSLPDLSKIRPKEIPIPENLEFDQSLFGFATQHNLQPAIDDEINKLYAMFSGNQMGIATDSYLSYQNIQAKEAR